MCVLALTTGCSGGSDGPECEVGAACDDQDDRTINDVFYSDCICRGATDPCYGSEDADGDGICGDRDCDDQDASVTATDEDGDGICGDIDCDDNDAGNTDTDIDGDGWCSSEDCSDLAPAYYPGAPCDDGNPSTIEDQVTTSCTCEGHYPYGSMTDPRDGREYLTIAIGPHTLLAENLNYETGDWWCYDDSVGNCDVYGKLYNWVTALEACPEGWHLPSNAEWDQVINALGGNAQAGGKMKNTIAWELPNTGATNSSGFTGLPGGCRTFSGLFSALGTSGFWWSSTLEGNNVLTPALRHNISEVQRLGTHRGDGFSIRCFRD